MLEIIIPWNLYITSDKEITSVNDTKNTDYHTGSNSQRDYTKLGKWQKTQ